MFCFELRPGVKGVRHVRDTDLSTCEDKDAYRDLKAKNDPRFTAYRLKDVPGRLEFNRNAREGDPVLIQKELVR